jgi:catecholate siderophore receptor
MPLVPTLGFASLGLLSAGTARAQAPDPVAVPEVSVTGQSSASPYRRAEEQTTPRSPIPIAEAPQTITVIPGEVIQERNATSVREALRNVTGISLAAGEGGFSGDNLTLRGFSARGDFFIDGIRDLGQYTRDTFFLDHIEVLKGPSAAQFGRGSTGGVINQTSRLPLDYTTGELSISGYAPGGVRSVGNVNVRAGDVAARMIAMGSRIESADRGRDGEVHQSRWGIAPSITYGVGKPTQFTLSYVHQEETNIPDFGVPFVNGRPAPVGRGTWYGLRDLDEEHTLTDIVTARLAHDFGNGIRLSNTTRYGSWSREVSATAPRAIGAIGPNTNLNDVNINRQAQVRNGYDSLWLNQTEVTANVNTGFIRHALLAGFEISRESSEVVRFSQTGRPTARFFSPDSLQTGNYVTTPNSDVRTVADTYAFYATDQIKIGEMFEVVAGIRYDNFDADYVNRTARQRFGRTDSEFSYRGALVFKPIPTLRTYVSFGTSFNPSAESLTLAANNAQLPPETARSYEAGLQWEVFDHTRLTAALFRTTKTNARTEDPANSTLQVLDGDVRVDGFEVGITGRIMEGWNILAGYTFLDSEIRKSTNPNEVGKEFANVPPHSFSLWTTYDLPRIGGVEGIQIGGGVQYVDRRFGNTSNTNRVPSFTRYDAAVAYEPTEGALKGLRLQVNALNLGNTRAFETVYTGHVVEAPGRTFVFTASARF